MYKVSVILPIYNVSQYLRECLDSVVRQTLKELEIICVNDGSTDNSLEIIEEYAAKDERIVIITGPNGGYGKAMNKGLDRATGEYVGIVEPDDYVSLTMFEDLYRIAVENQLDMVKADFYRFERNEHGDMDMRYVYLDNTKQRYGELLHPYQDPSIIRFTMNTWSGIYRRTMLDEYHIRHNETPGASYQDNGFFFQTMVHSKQAMIVNYPYYRNRQNNPNSSVNSREKVYCSNIEYAFIRNLLVQDKDIWERFKYIYTWKMFHNYLFTIDRISEEFRVEYVRKISKEFKEAMQRGEFKKDVFTALEWKKIMMILENPEEYLDKYASKSGNNLPFQQGGSRFARQEADLLRRELDMIKNSTTYKVGKIIMAVPCALKRKILSK